MRTELIAAVPVIKYLTDKACDLCDGKMRSKASPLSHKVNYKWSKIKGSELLKIMSKGQNLEIHRDKEVGNLGSSENI